MTKTLFARYSGTLAVITSCIVIVPGLAVAQKFEYRDVIKTLDVKAPPRKSSEAKPADTKNAEVKPSEALSADTKSAEAKNSETKLAATNAQAKPTEVRSANPITQTEDQLPKGNWLHTRWHMSLGQVAAISRNIVPTTTAERRDHTNPDNGIALLKARYVENEIEYRAFYWFHDSKLVAVAVKSGDFRHWPTVNKALERAYGKPSEEKSKTSSTEGMRCVVTDRKWISESQSTVIKFLAQDCDRSPTRHWNFYSIHYEPIATAGKIAHHAARF